MIREVAGVLDRHGPARLEAPFDGALHFARGPLAVAWTGGPAAVDGDALSLVDGLLDRDPRTDAEGAPADPDQALLAAWRARGDSVASALRGDFGAVLWDGRRGLLMRDQMGVRGLYWHDDGGRLRFASELHLLLALLPVQPGPDRVGVAHWLNVSGPPGERTLFAGLHRLEAAHVLALDPAGPRPAKRYWELRYSEPRLAPRSEYSGRWRDALERAVARRCADGSETGILLSGGLDSSSVAALLPELDPRPRAYSAVFPAHPETDESELIAELCAQLGLTSMRATVRGGSPIAGALDYLDRWGVPPVSPNMFFWRPLLERAAADGVRVLLDGEGGDELFGLSGMLVADRLRARDPLGAIALVYRAPGALGRPSRRSVRRYLLRLGVGPLAPAWLGRALGARGARSRVPDWMTTDTARAFVETTAGASYKRLDGPRWWATLVDTCVTGSGPSLAYDHIRQRAAAAGIAARHPICDVDVVETILATPPDMSFDPFVTRPLLREAVAGRLPERVRQRTTKSNFDSVFHSGLTLDLPAARSLLGNQTARIGAYVDRPLLVERLLDRTPASAAGQMTRGLYLWRALTAECWLRSLEDPASAKAVAGAAGLAAASVEIVAT